MAYELHQQLTSAMAGKGVLDAEDVDVVKNNTRQTLLQFLATLLVKPSVDGIPKMMLNGEFVQMAAPAAMITFDNSNTQQLSATNVQAAIYSIYTGLRTLQSTLSTLTVGANKVTVYPPTYALDADNQPYTVGVNEPAPTVDLNTFLANISKAVFGLYYNGTVANEIQTGKLGYDDPQEYSQMYVGGQESVVMIQGDGGIIPKDGANYNFGQISELIISNRTPCMKRGCTMIFSVATGDDFKVVLPYTFSSTTQGGDTRDNVPDCQSFMLDKDEFLCEGGNTYILTISPAQGGGVFEEANIYNLQKLITPTTASNGLT